MAIKEVTAETGKAEHSAIHLDSRNAARKEKIFRGRYSIALDNEGQLRIFFLGGRGLREKEEGEGERRDALRVL